MGRNSPSARRHRALKFLGHLWQYKTYGPLIGPKEAHQPDYRRGLPAEQQEQDDQEKDQTAQADVHGEPLD